MAQDFYTMTPGSAVADTIQQILQRRRDESRQAMLDKLEHEQLQMRQRESEANMAAQKAQTEHNTQSLQLQKDRETRDRDKDLRDELYRRLQSARSGAKLNDPQLLQEAERLGAMVDTPDYTPPGVLPTQARMPEGGVDALPEGAELPQQDFDPTIKGQRVFAGVGEAGEAFEARQRAEQLLRNPEFQNANPTQRAIMAISAGVNPQTLPDPLMPLTIVSHTGKVTQDFNTMVPGNQSVAQLPQPYASGRGGVGNTTPRAAYMVKPSTGERVVLTAAGGDIISQMDEAEAQGFQFERWGSAAQPTSANLSPSLIGKLASVKSRYEALRDQREASSTYFGLGGPPGPSLEEQQLRGEYESLRNQAFANDPAPQNIKDLAAEFVANGWSLEEGLDALEPEDAARFNSNPINMQHLQRLLSR
jgi:hypothetical protein